MGSANFIANNVARSNTTNYIISGANRVGAIVVPPNSGAISGNSGGGSGATDPWSNIAY